MKINWVSLIVQILLSIGRHLLTTVGGAAGIAGLTEDNPKYLVAAAAMIAAGLGASLKRQVDRAKAAQNPAPPAAG